MLDDNAVSLLIADRAEAYYRLEKEMRKEMKKKDFQEQEDMLGLQWWEDVLPWFANEKGEAWWITT